MQPWEAQKIDNLQHGVVIIRNILYFVRKRQTVRNALKKTNVRRARPLREGKVRKEFWLDPSLLRRAQKDLGAVLISGNEQDLNRIRRVFSFQSAAPYPKTI